jgi:hypothetical protein
MADSQLQSGESRSEVGVKHRLLRAHALARTHDGSHPSFGKLDLHMALPKMDAMDSINNAMLMDDAKLHLQLKKVFLRKHLRLQLIVDQ